MGVNPSSSLGSPNYEDYLAATLNAVDVAVFSIMLSSGNIINFNEKLCTDIEKTPEQVSGVHYKNVFWEEFILHLEDLLAKASFDEPVTSLYYWTMKMIWGQISLRKVYGPLNVPIAVVSVTNTTDIIRSEYEYRRMAFFDQQLDIPNGRKLEQDVAALTCYDHVALIHLDIHRFSTVNEVYGWDTGDYLLEQIRNWLLGTAVEGCKLYRVSEDEFAMLIQNITLMAAKKRGRQVLARFKQPWKVASTDTLPLYCTVKMGLVYGNYLEGDIRNQLFRTVMAGRHNGGLTMYDAKMDKRIKKDLLLRQTLVICLQQNMRGFSVYYQPIVNPRTGGLDRAEALCRWSHPTFGNVSPAVFVLQLEQLGLIDDLDNWVLETAVQQCVKWGLTTKDFMLDVNLSPLQRMDADYSNALVEFLCVHNYPHEKLCLEITESGKYDFSTENLAALQNLRDKGICISLDDFGTGYSSFENLMRLPARILKTEKSFIDLLETDPYQQYLLRMMVDLAHTAKLEIISEGVETEGQRKLLVEYGVDFVQGYLYSKPLSAVQFAKHVHEFQPDNATRQQK